LLEITFDQNKNVFLLTPTLTLNPKAQCFQIDEMTSFLSRLIVMV